MATVEFAVLDAKGETLDTVDPYISHTDMGEGHYLVYNGYGEYAMFVPPGGRFEIRARF